MEKNEYRESLRQHLRQLLEQVRAKHGDDRHVPQLFQIWNGSMDSSPKRGVLEFHGGRLFVGVWCPEKDSPGKWLTRLIIGVARATVHESLCAGMTTWLQIATDELGWACEVDCDACYETGVCSTSDCPKCVWKLENCAKNNKFVWPELVGRPAWLASLILKTLQPGRRVILDPWDMLYQTPANPDVIRIVYDAKTGLVVTPAPHVTSSPEISGPRDACFSSVGGGVCYGAPPNPPPAEWASLVGQSLGTSALWLKARYPHAVVVPTPHTALITRDLRHDRIRLRYDPLTMKVTHVPTVG